MFFFVCFAFLLCFFLSFFVFQYVDVPDYQFIVFYQIYELWDKVHFFAENRRLGETALGPFWTALECPVEKNATAKPLRTALAAKTPQFRTAVRISKFKHQKSEQKNAPWSRMIIKFIDNVAYGPTWRLINGNWKKK